MLPGQNSIPLSNVKDMLDMVGIKLAMFKVRDVINDLKNNNEVTGESLSRLGFEKVILFSFCR